MTSVESKDQVETELDKKKKKDETKAVESADPMDRPTTASIVSPTDDKKAERENLEKAVKVTSFTTALTGSPDPVEPVPLPRRDLSRPNLGHLQKQQDDNAPHARDDRAKRSARDSDAPPPRREVLNPRDVIEAFRGEYKKPVLTRTPVAPPSAGAVKLP